LGQSTVLYSIDSVYAMYGATLIFRELIMSFHCPFHTLYCSTGRVWRVKRSESHTTVFFFVVQHCTVLYAVESEVGYSTSSIEIREGWQMTTK